MIDPVIEWLYLHLKEGSLHELSELRRAGFFILGFSGSTRVIRKFSDNLPRLWS